MVDSEVGIEEDSTERLFRRKLPPLVFETLPTSEISPGELRKNPALNVERIQNDDKPITSADVDTPRFDLSQ